MKKRDFSGKSIVSLITRREVLGFFGGAAAVSVLGCWQGTSASSKSTESTSRLPGCRVKPQLTEGPYFVDDKLNRSDLRSEPSGGTMRAGVPLQLAFRVLRSRDNVCEPLPDAMVDVWHCDAQGIYSDVRDRSFNTVGQKFLRGYQVTDAQGRAEFITIYPGWYPGRAVHIHFKIRGQGELQANYEFTSQLFFDDTLSDRVFTQSPYQKAGRRKLNREDGIFRQGGEQLIPEITKTAEGYAVQFEIALQFA